MQLHDTLLEALGYREFEKTSRTAAHRIDKIALKELGGDYRALLVEDNLINQMVAQTLLEDANYQVDVVDNGIKAIEAFSKNSYTLILMDIQMPDMDGFEATRKIRELEKEKDHHTPIIAMTAYAMKEDRERCLTAGMDDYISKPLDENEFAEILLKWSRPTLSDN